MDDLKQKILNMLMEKKPDIVIPEDTSVNLLNTGVIDSFDIVDLISSLEETFEIEVDGDDIIPENFESVNAICSLIEVKYDVK